jgi:hypothetical protein
MIGPSRMRFRIIIPVFEHARITSQAVWLQYIYNAGTQRPSKVTRTRIETVHYNWQFLSAFVTEVRMLCHVSAVLPTLLHRVNKNGLSGYK